MTDKHAALPAQPSRPSLAYKNEPFLASADARTLRILSEYLEPLSHLRRSANPRHGGIFRLGPDSRR